MPDSSWIGHSQIIHVWYIYLHLGHLGGFYVGKYTIHGRSGQWTLELCNDLAEFSIHDGDLAIKDGNSAIKNGELAITDGELANLARLVL